MAMLDYRRVPFLPTIDTNFRPKGTSNLYPPPSLNLPPLKPQLPSVKPMQSM